MLLKFNRFLPFYSPDDSQSSNTGDLTVNETIKFLEDDDTEDKPLELDDKKKAEKKEPEDEDEEKPPVEDEEDDEEKDDEDKEDEIEIDDDELDLVVPVRRKEILAKYPNIFKDFPHLERAYYKEQQYTEILPTLDDAREAVEKARALDNFEKDLLSGNTERMLEAVKKQDQNSFYRIVDNYLDALHKVDNNAYFHVVGSIIKSTVVSMLNEARRLGENGEPLKIAAQLVNQYIFGSSEFEPTKPLAKETKDEDDSLEKQKREFIQQQYDYAREDLTTRVDNVLKSTINANIDPKNSMTDYVKKNASREALEAVRNAINNDTRFKAIIDKLWDAAFKSKFSKPSVDKIRSAYLSRAKTLLPDVIKKARNEALKGMGKRVNESNDETPDKKKKGLPAVGRTTSTSAKSDREKAKEIPHGMKSVDFLLQD